MKYFLEIQEDVSVICHDDWRYRLSGLYPEGASLKKEVLCTKVDLSACKGVWSSSKILSYSGTGKSMHRSHISALSVFVVLLRYQQKKCSL